MNPLNSMKYSVYSLKERPDLQYKQEDISNEAWPAFMLPEAISNVNKYRGEITHLFPEYQLVLFTGDEIISTINTIPIYINNINELSDEGWDWGLKKAVLDKKKGIKGNSVFGIQIVVRKKFQNQGIGSIAVHELIQFTKRINFHRIVLPVRPVLKCKYPLIPFDDYIKLNNNEGLPYDPWLRKHVRKGGEIIKSCPNSMNIQGSVDDWMRWTGMDFPFSGEYIVPEANNPIKIDLAKQIGYYTEPNVWIVYNL